jgi:hypothetical protein
MDPLTLALLAGGASLIGGLPDIIPSKFEKEQKKRLQDLQRRQELGTLGLSPEEQALIGSQFETQQAQADARQKALMEQYSSLQGTPAGSALAMQEAGLQGKQIGAQQARAVAQANLAQKAAQEQEIIDLQAAQGEMARQRAEALVAPLEAGAGAFLQGQTLQTLAGTPKKTITNQMTGQPQEVDMRVVNNYMKQFGLNEQEALQLYEEFDIKDQYYLGL